MHGGDIYTNRIEMDFSVNVNPLGVPGEVAGAIKNSIERITSYPDIDCRKLRGNLGQYFDMSEKHILCGNGASELIVGICRWKMPRTALLLAPGFSGYERALDAVGCKITYHYLLEENDFACHDDFLWQVQAQSPDIIFISNPANPTGTFYGIEYMTKLARTCDETGTMLVVDECFMELSEKYSESMVTKLSVFDNLLILRAFTKSFALPGIRLGYLLCPRETVAKEIMQQLPEWNVSIAAQEAGVAALKNTGYLEDSRAFIKEQKMWLEEKLSGMGLKVYPSNANYILFRSTKDDLYQVLLEEGVLIRDCSDYPGLGKGYFRVAVKSISENRKLTKILKRLL